MTCSRACGCWRQIAGWNCRRYSSMASAWNAFLTWELRLRSWNRSLLLNRLCRMRGFPGLVVVDERAIRLADVLGEPSPGRAVEGAFDPGTAGADPAIVVGGLPHACLPVRQDQTAELEDIRRTWVIVGVPGSVAADD